MIRIFIPAPTPAWPDRDPLLSVSLAKLKTAACVLGLLWFLGSVGAFISIWGN